MRKFVRDIRRAQDALGDGEKFCQDNETKPIKKMRKSIVASRDLEAGHVIAEGDRAYRSPGGGMLPYERDALIGKSLVSAMKEDDQFAPESVG